MYSKSLLMPKRKRIIREKVPLKGVSEKSISLPISRQPIISRLLSRKNTLLITLFLLIVLIWKLKGYLIVATVNGQPISRWELTDKLTRRFGGQTLDDIINERLLLAALRQKGIFIPNQEIDARIKQIEERLKDSLSLAEALKAQGLTTEEFRRQIEIQSSIDKLFDKEATTSSSEIEEYIRKNNQAYKSATDPVSVREEVKAILRQQKISDLFDSWFSQIRKDAKIAKFL